MNDAKETKLMNLKITEEVKERFINISKEEGWNQDEALKKLISMYEMKQVKKHIRDRRTEIETFEAHLQSLSNIYLMSIQLNQDAEERIKSTYANTLESKEKIIQVLQERNQELTRALEVKEIINEKNKQLKKEIERMLGEMDKTETLCQQYKEKNDTLNGLLVEYQQDHEENKNLKEKLKEMDKIQADLDRLHAELEASKIQAESELKIRIIELKEEHHKQMEELKDRKHKEIEEITSNYRDLLKKLDAMREEHYKLKEEMLETFQQKKIGNSNDGNDHNTTEI